MDLIQDFMLFEFLEFLVFLGFLESSWLYPMLLSIPFNYFYSYQGNIHKTGGIYMSHNSGTCRGSFLF